MRTMILAAIGSLTLNIAAAIEAPSAASQSRHPPKVLVGRQQAAPEPQITLPSFVRFPDEQYALTTGFKFTFRETRRSVVVPAGFVTDFASIPGMAHLFFSRDQHDLPGLVHDFLYWRQSCTRDQADKLFEVALAQLGVPKAKRVAMYLAVHLAGGPAWNENAQDRSRALPRIIPSSFMQIPAVPWKDYRERLHRRHVPLDRRDPQPPDYCSAATGNKPS